MERVYLDTCVWCRPFDKAKEKRIIEESGALHGILAMADRNEIEIIGSSVLLFEVSMIDAVEKKGAVKTLVERSITHFTRITEKVEEMAEGIIEACGIDPMDSAHIALAIEGNANIFITTDNGILNKGECLSEFGIVVRNPVDYVKGE